MYFVHTPIYLVHRFKKAMRVVVDSSLSIKKKWSALLLLSSSTTLLCCALPILLVSLGFGSVVASIYSDYLPWLRWFGLHERLTFGITAVILIVASWLVFRKNRVCPTEPKLAEACEKAHRSNLKIVIISVVIWFVGAYAAFVMPWLY